MTNADAHTALARPVNNNSLDHAVASLPAAWARAYGVNNGFAGTTHSQAELGDAHLRRDLPRPESTESMPPSGAARRRGAMIAPQAPTKIRAIA